MVTITTNSESTSPLLETSYLNRFSLISIQVLSSPILVKMSPDSPNQHQMISLPQPNFHVPISGLQNISIYNGLYRFLTTTYGELSYFEHVKRGTAGIFQLINNNSFTILERDLDPVSRSLLFSISCHSSDFVGSIMESFTFTILLLCPLGENGNYRYQLLCKMNNNNNK